MFVSKSTRKNFVNYLEKKCNNSNISNKSLGIMIRSFHISSPLVILMAISCTSFFFATLSYIILIIVASLYIIFEGYVLSMLEKRLCKDSFILVDPIIEYSRLDVNYKNRKTFTAWIMFPHFFFCE